MSSIDRRAGERGGGAQGLAEAAVRGAAWTAAAKWAVRGCTLLAFALLARLLQPAEFGLLALATAVVEILRVAAQQGFTQTLVREPKIDDRSVSTAFWLCTTGSAVATAALVIAAPALELALSAPGLAPILQVLAFYLLLVGLGSVPEALLNRRLQFRELAVRTIVSTLCGIIVALVLAIAGFGVWALAAQMLAYAAVSTLLLWWQVSFRPALSLDVKRARGMLRFGWTVLLVDVGTAGISQSDKIVIGAMLGEAALGYYVVAFRLVSVLDEVSLS